jgi:hypothetical protein
MSDIESSLERRPSVYLSRLLNVSSVLWALSALACLALCIYVLTRAKYSGQDSWYPMRSAIEHLHGSRASESLYDLFFVDHIKFQYPPTALLLFDFLGALGIKTFYTLNLINAGLLIGTGWAFAMFSKQLLGTIKWQWFQVPIGPIAFILSVRFYPENLAFQIGQIQLFLGLLFLLACWAFVNERFVWAGSLIGVAATVKPQFAPLALLALWQRQWKMFAGILGVGVISLALSVALFGGRTHLDYISVLKFLSEHGEHQHLNQSINGLLLRWLYSGPSLDRDPSGLIPQSAFPPFIEPVYVTTLVSTIVMLAIPFLVKSKSDDRISRLLTFCSGSVFFTMASPIAWVHHYNILLPVYVVALRAGIDRWINTATWWVFLGTLMLSFLLVGYPLVPANSPTDSSMNILQSHVLIGALVLAGVLLVELRTAPKARRG